MNLVGIEFIPVKDSSLGLKNTRFGAIGAGHPNRLSLMEIYFLGNSFKNSERLGRHP